MAMNIDLKNINMSDIKEQITKLLANKINLCSFINKSGRGIEFSN